MNTPNGTLSCPQGVVTVLDPAIKRLQSQLFIPGSTVDSESSSDTNGIGTSSNLSVNGVNYAQILFSEVGISACHTPEQRQITGLTWSAVSASR